MLIPDFLLSPLPGSFQLRQAGYSSFSSHIQLQPSLAPFHGLFSPPLSSAGCLTKLQPFLKASISPAPSSLPPIKGVFPAASNPQAPSSFLQPLQHITSCAGVARVLWPDVSWARSISHSGCSPPRAGPVPYCTGSTMGSQSIFSCH